MKKSGYKGTLMYSVITIFLLSTSFTVSSQNFGGCATDDYIENHNSKDPGCTNSSDSWLNEYRTPGYWIPNMATPIKTILVNWVICRDNNGQNGWQDTPEFRTQVDLMFSHINTWYSNSLPKGYSLTCEPNYTHIYDTRIRFELNEIIFIDSSNFNTSCSIVEILDFVHTNYPSSLNALNHFFTMPINPCVANA